MPQTRIAFAEHSYVDRSVPVSAQQLLNMYLERKPDESLTHTAIHGTPGLKLWTTAGTSYHRGMLKMGQYLYVVNGETLYKVDSAGAATYVMAIRGVLPVHMAQDGSRMVIASDNKVYFTNILGASSTISGLTNINGAAFQDGYILLTKRESKEFYLNDISVGLPTDEPVYNIATEFGVAISSPDNNMGIANSNRSTLIFGENSIERFVNTGNPDFPFERTPSGVIERGTISTDSIVSYQGFVAWLGDDKTVYRLDGDIPVSISTNAIDILIQGFGAHESSQAFIYTQDKHTFYVLTFPGYGTIVYDLTTDRWHERKSFAIPEWRVRGHTVAFGKTLVGDYKNGNIYELDLDTYDDDGGTIIRRMTAPPIGAQGERIITSTLQVDLDTGLGLAAGQGSDPQLMLDWSNNGGRTWSNEHWRSAGSLGDYTHRAIWRRLGMDRNRVYRLTMSDPIKAAWFRGYANLRGAGR